MMRGKIPRHDPFRLEKTPLKIAITPLPGIAEVQRVLREACLPAYDYAGERSAGARDPDGCSIRPRFELNHTFCRRESRTRAIRREDYAILVFDKYPSRQV